MLKPFLQYVQSNNNCACVCPVQWIPMKQQNHKTHHEAKCCNMASHSSPCLSHVLQWLGPLLVLPVLIRSHFLEGVM